MQIEVESRGPLTEESFEKLKIFLEENGKFKEKKERILIDYSAFTEGGIRDRSLDIRARITNGQPELIIKKGKWGGSESREEISVMCKEGEFTNLVKAYAALGYKKGVTCERTIYVYGLEEFEFSLTIAPGHHPFFEVELLVEDESKVKEARKKIDKKCSKLKLNFFTDETWYEYTEYLNDNCNKVFDIEKDGENYFKRKYGI